MDSTFHVPEALILTLSHQGLTRMLKLAYVIAVNGIYVYYRWQYLITEHTKFIEPEALNAAY